MTEGALGRTRNLLVVDDNQSILELIRRFLIGTEFAVRTAVGGREALEVFESAESHFDLVLTDIVMPEMDGPELVRRLRARAPELPIVLMTGYTENFRDPIPCLSKPFTRAGLIGMLRNAVQSRRKPVGSASGTLGKTASL